MNEADKAFVEQSETWIKTQETGIAYNVFLIEMYRQQMSFLKKKIEVEEAEMLANSKTLEAYKKELEQFIEERK